MGTTKTPVIPSKPSIPATIDATLSVWKNIGSMIGAVEAPSSTDSLIVNCVGDSLTAGHKLADRRNQAWPEQLNSLLCHAIKPGGNLGYTEFNRGVCESTNNQSSGVADYSNAAITSGSSFTADERLTIPSGTKRVWIFDTNGIETLGLAWHPGIQTDVIVDLWSGNRLVTQPAGSGDIANFTAAANQWRISLITAGWGQNIITADSNNVIYGEYQNCMQLIFNKKTIAFGASPGGSTVSITSSAGFGNSVNHLFIQRGGHAYNNYVAAVNNGRWGQDPNATLHSTASDTGAIASGRKYYPTIGSTPTVGDTYQFDHIFRFYDKFQAKNFRAVASNNASGQTGSGAGTTPTGWIGTYGCTKMVVIDAHYTNGISDDASSTALVASKTTLRDRVVAQGGIYIALFLPPTNAQSSGTFMATYKNGMKAMVANDPHSGYIDLTAICGTSRTTVAQTFDFEGFDSDKVHFNAKANTWIAERVQEVLLYSKVA